MPTVKEYLRENLSGHTCDRRSTRTYIEKAYPDYVVEKGFSKTDELWVEGMAEPTIDQDITSKATLDDIFDNDEGVYLSITSHSGNIATLLTGMSCLCPFVMCEVVECANNMCRVEPPSFQSEHWTDHPGVGEGCSDQGVIACYCRTAIRNDLDLCCAAYQDCDLRCCAMRGYPLFMSINCCNE